MSNRLARFRDYMARFDAAASPAHAIERGFYVERPGRSVAEEIAGRIELRPSSTHLLVGGVGAGKTTQLLMAKGQLQQLPDVHVVYLDISEKYDLSHLKPGVLPILAGLAIGELLEGAEGEPPPAAKAYFAVVAQYADWRAIDVMDRSLMNRVGTMLHELCDELGARVALLIDSLDRLVDTASFARIVSEDLATIRGAGIGLALVGPLGAMYGANRPITDRFDYFIINPWSTAKRTVGVWSS